MATLKRVLIKNVLDDTIGWPSKIARIIADKSFLASCTIFIATGTNHCSRFQGNCDDYAVANIRASPPAGCRKKLLANMEIRVLHRDQILAEYCSICAQRSASATAARQRRRRLEAVVGRHSHLPFAAKIRPPTRSAANTPPQNFSFLIWPAILERWFCICSTEAPAMFNAWNSFVQPGSSDGGISQTTGISFFCAMTAAPISCCTYGERHAARLARKNTKFAFLRFWSIA